jgi:hypothetical protein
MGNKAKPSLFADDTSVLITAPNTAKLQNDINIVFEQINKWFEGNFLSLNLDKTHFIPFMNKSIYTTDMCIKYDDKQTSNITNTKFLGLFTNYTLSWKTHIEYIMPKLRSACYVTRSVKPHLSQNTLKMIHYSYFHSIMTYGLLFWGHSSDSVKIFRVQKKIIRNTLGCRSRDSCRNLFTKLKILPLPSQFILSLLLFVMTNRNQYTFNSEVYHIDTRQHFNFHQPLSGLVKYERGVYCLGVKVFNGLPSYIKDASNSPKRFKLILKDFLHENSFYSLDKYFKLNKNQ